MPRYKLSPEERAAEKERKENLRNIMNGLNIKNFDDIKDAFKLMVGEMLENGLEGELDEELGYTKWAQGTVLLGTGDGTMIFLLPQNLRLSIC